jgi:hypothetical protein
MFQVMIELRQGDVDVLRPGLSARAEVVVDKKPSSLLVPRVAVDLQGTQPKVTLASGGSAEIRLGGCSGEVCVVSSGLEEGARVRRVTQ